MVFVRVCDFRLYIRKNITPMGGVHDVYVCVYVYIVVCSHQSFFVRQYVGPHNGQFRKPKELSFISPPPPSLCIHLNFIAYNKNITLLKLILLENMETNEDVNRVRIILLLQ